MYTVYFRKTATSEENIFLTGIPTYNLAERTCRQLVSHFNVMGTRIERD